MVYFLKIPVEPSKERVVKLANVITKARKKI